MGEGEAWREMMTNTSAEQDEVISICTWAKAVGKAWRDNLHEVHRLD
jgi:hypothetical protein